MGGGREGVEVDRAIPIIRPTVTGLRMEIVEIHPFMSRIRPSVVLFAVKKTTYLPFRTRENFSSIIFLVKFSSKCRQRNGLKHSEKSIYVFNVSRQGTRPGMMAIVLISSTVHMTVTKVTREVCMCSFVISTKVMTPTKNCSRSTKLSSLLSPIVHIKILAKISRFPYIPLIMLSMAA